MQGKPQEKPIIIVQGAQWGSEGKGMVAAALCECRQIDYAVRTGAVNAGHTVYYRGRPYKMQQLPTGWVNPGTVLVLGPGAYINPAQLLKECRMIKDALREDDPRNVFPLILIDPRAGLHLPEHTERAAQSNRHYTIGATGKGCSEAIVDRIRLRGSGEQLFRDWYRDNVDHPDFDWLGGAFVFEDTAERLNWAYDHGKKILLEGTQGSMLDLYLGPYPYTTHKQCIASQWVTEAGLSPNMFYEVVSCVRTYPIRVAGNSGPMPGEITWPYLAREINRKLMTKGMLPRVDEAALERYDQAFQRLEGNYVTTLAEASCRATDAFWRLSLADQDELAKVFERTTVTNKLRRVAELDMPGLVGSLRIDRPSWVCITFLNHQFPEYWGRTDMLPGEINNLYKGYIETFIESTNVPVGAFTLGPESSHFYGCSQYYQLTIDQ